MFFFGVSPNERDPPPINLDAQIFSVKEILDWARPPHFGEKFSFFSDKILLDWVKPPPFWAKYPKKRSGPPRF